MTTDKDETTEQAATANENETVGKKRREPKKLKRISPYEEGKKRGAPSVPDELKRNSPYVLNLTAEEKQQYMDYAKAKKMKFSALLRTAVDEYMREHKI